MASGQFDSPMETNDSVQWLKKEASPYHTVLHDPGREGRKRKEKAELSYRPALYPTLGVLAGACM